MLTRATFAVGNDSVLPSFVVRVQWSPVSFAAPMCSLRWKRVWLPSGFFRMNHFRHSWRSFAAPSSLPLVFGCFLVHFCIEASKVTPSIGSWPTISNSMSATSQDFASIGSNL